MLYRRNSDDFEKWVKSYEKKYEEGMKVFGEHMGLDPETTCRMVDAVRIVHEVINNLDCEIEILPLGAWVYHL